MICPWGEDGAAALTNTRDSVLVTSPAVSPPRVVDTLAAGDTFIAATLSALSLGRTLQEAMTYGCTIAGAKCGMQGLQGLKECPPC